MSPEEWDATSWHTQRTYLEGLEADGTVKFESSSESVAADLFEAGVQHREVDTGGKVIDITGMIGDLEAERQKRRR